MSNRIESGVALKSLILAAIAVVALASNSAADAADLPRAAPAYKAPVAAPAFSWTGCYIGGHVGWMKNDGEVSSGPQAGFSATQIAQNTFTYGADESSFTGGVQYGCNRQYGHWVLGLDSSFSWAGINESFSASRIGVNHPDYTESLTQELNSYWTTRARVGWAHDRWMIFAAGGLATGRVESSTATNFVLFPGGVFVGSESKNRYGWTIGGGVEYALSQNWWLRGEYLYVDLGKYSYTSLAPGPGFGALSWSTKVDTQFHVARVALSYRFTTAGSLLEWAMGGFK